MNQQDPINEKIKTAFVQLLEEQPFSAIRVTSISKRAGVSHQSFYRCYPNKYELAISYFSQQMNNALLFCGKAATVRDVLITILTIVKNNAPIYSNLLQDDEGAKLFPEILSTLSMGWTGFEPAWATTVINSNILIDWANMRFSSSVEEVYEKFIYSLPAYELLTAKELTLYVKQYESRKASDFREHRQKNKHI